ncbi:MAG: ketopantoate reductase family protein [Halobacteriaceae archaeon]
MDVLVLGGGAMGSLFAAHLAGGGHAVTLLDRHDDHVAAVRERGLELVTPEGDSRRVSLDATSDPGDAPVADLLLVCVKTYETDDALASTGPCRDGETLVLTLQNGLGNAETVAGHVPRSNVLAGTTAHGATREGPGRVRHAGRGPTRLGRYFGENDRRVRAVADALTASGVETDVVADVRDAVWEKVLVNVGINAATALARVPNGALAERDPGRRLATAAVEEAAAVARAEGRDVPADPVAETLAVARRTATNVSSMRADLERGERTEVEALHGAVAERADQRGVAVPVNRTLADLVRLAEPPGHSDSGGRGQS